IDAPLSAGLGVWLFDVPVLPTPRMIADIAKARLLEELRSRGLRREDLSIEAASAALARIATEVVSELDRPFRVRERPKAAVTLEVAHLPVHGVWQVRGAAAIGILGVAFG